MILLRAMKPYTPLRYPGGKGKLTDFMKLVFEENELLDGHYVEPFAGGAGIAISLLILEYASCIHLNDLNRSVYAFWHSVINETDEFCKMIGDAKLDMSEWHKQRSIQLNSDDFDLLTLGFSTFYLNRTNRSGIILGGVIGGKNQDGPWKLDARFNKPELCKRIQSIANYRSRVKLYNLDALFFLRTVQSHLPEKSLIYLDPPYYVKADRLYQNFYRHQDHLDIAKAVQEKLKTPWIVSYDNMPEIIEMYKESPKITYGMNYSAAKRYEGSEAMFFSQSLSIPQVKNPAKVKVA